MRSPEEVAALIQGVSSRAVRYMANRHMPAHEFCRQCGKPIVVTLRPAVFDRNVLAFDVAGFFQTLAECAKEVRIRSGRSAMKITDHWHNPPLRARRERPRDCGAAQKRDDLAALQLVELYSGFQRLRCCMFSMVLYNSGNTLAPQTQT